MRPYTVGPQINYTPNCIEHLAPGCCKLHGVYIVWRRTISQWEARYKGAVPKQSLNKTWAGLRNTLTEAEALYECLHWMWCEHAKGKHCEADKREPPIREVIAETLKGAA